MIEIVENFVDWDFEKEVLNLIPKRITKTKERNQILRFGSRKPYPNNMVSSIIPKVFKDLEGISFDSVTVNEYRAGQRIDWHIDKPDGGDSIYIISLLSTAVIKFRKDNKVQEYVLPRYSLAIMSEDLRYNWEHSLTAKEQRVSVVLRNSGINIKN